MEVVALAELPATALDLELRVFLGVVDETWEEVAIAWPEVLAGTALWAGGRPRCGGEETMRRRADVRA